MKNKHFLILSIIGSLLLVSIAIASSYAYFTANVTGNKDANNVVITNGVMSLEYKDGDEITLDNAIPGSSVTKTFTVKNTGNVTTNYTIYFSELYNTFADKTDLVYTLTSSDGGQNVSQTQVPDSSGIMADNVSIEPNTTHTYSLKIIFLDKDENQDDNQDKQFKTKLQINEVKDYIPTFAEKIVELSQTDTTNFATDDPDHNIRYIGANPNNYVYFNCSDYSNQTDDTCEKWRIIGVFKNVSKADGTKGNLLKIIKTEILNNENIKWDHKQSGVGTSTTNYGSNDWTDSQLMMMLNPTDYLKSGYTIENNVVKDSNGQEIYQNMGSYYYGTLGCQPSSIAKGSSFNCTSADFTSSGLKNDLTRNTIESVIWNIGGTSTYSSVNNGLASHWYGYERGNNVYSGHATTWTGKIGLMYPSDYGYATSGGTTMDRSACLAKELYNWDSVTECYSNDYLYILHTNQWTLTAGLSDARGIARINTDGYVRGDTASSTSFSARPSLYLKSDISISQGEGSSENPYQLKLD